MPAKDQKKSAEKDLAKKVNEEKPPEDEIIEPEIMKDIPPEYHDKFREGFKEIAKMTSFEMMSIGPQFNPIFKKLTPEHIDKMIEYSDKDDERNLKFEKFHRRFLLIPFFTLIAVFLFLLIWLIDVDKQMLIDILWALGGFAGGLGTGWGLGSRRRSSNA